MDAANTTGQAEQIKTDTHQTACVKNETSPPYAVQIRGEEEKHHRKGARNSCMQDAQGRSPSSIHLRQFAIISG